MTKKGIVGVFCRTYSISAAIEKFLPDVYRESEKPGRYDYILGTGFAGVQIFEDKFAYSHHATDPAYGKLLNSFDLVRTHKFPDDEESFKKMAEFASDLLFRERQEDANIEFSDEEWLTNLKYTKENKLENSVWNLLLILRNDEAYANFAYNEMARMVEVTGGVSWDRPNGNRFWLDSDSNALKADLDIRYTSFSTRNHDVAFSKIAMERKFNPIKDYLDGLPAWDGVERVPNLLIKYMNAEDTEYVRTVTRKTFSAAVARIYRPGIKFDSLLVLDGEQGIGKSSLFRELVGEEYFSDSLQLSDIDGKTAAEKIQGSWIIEIAELAGMKKAEIEKVKAFLSSSDDKYRPSYGKVVESHPRSCILVATVNGQEGYLRDIRFWIVKLKQTEQKKEYDISSDEKDQIWAEAKYYYENGEKLYLENAELIKAAAEVQKEALETDERLGMVELSKNFSPIIGTA